MSRCGQGLTVLVAISSKENVVTDLFLVQMLKSAVSVGDVGLDWF